MSEMQARRQLRELRKAAKVDLDLPHNELVAAITNMRVLCDRLAPLVDECDALVETWRTRRRQVGGVGEETYGDGLHAAYGITARELAEVLERVKP